MHAALSGTPAQSTRAYTSGDATQDLSPRVHTAAGRGEDGDEDADVEACAELVGVQRLRGVAVVCSATPAAVGVLRTQRPGRRRRGASGAQSLRQTTSRALRFLA